MSPWRFIAYHPRGVGCPIRDWYDAQHPKVRTAFDFTVGILKGTDVWIGTREFRELEGEHLGLAEVRFNVEFPKPGSPSGQVKRRFRPLGVWRPREREFVFLVGYEKSGRMWLPSNAFKLAFRFKREFELGMGEVNDYL